ncbi:MULTISPECIES: hypothetical protein [Streptomyces]|uniref:hypothetical protein n=1 Tax=Streptomyces TaxID=1883 RepID=UPI0004C57A08|nr:MULTISPECIES: hypothetical protein [unclassified Streptomyces]KJY18944.1 hypothetical protein VR43_22510 [Streptomyces sp. NRRL S-104]KOU94588.1 hypothetical protein ADK93_05395 [Streptomyces sp. XY58]KOV10931.1 hypothetical protein ADK89_05375 [Streptomyces sp. XY37]KOV54239.1 hypothetical protein ADK99_05755 [Streptomyces sp. MMG1064]
MRIADSEYFEGELGAGWASCSPRALIDAVPIAPIVFREQGPEGRRFGEHLPAFGNERVRAEVREAPTETH